mmetsp:Transcript_35278/g.69520  ORF Transcript_35278/g.69520 Transcript_35278/m.69520 type:complete len:122 (+) Transcript_35278:71-436(+)
MELGDGSDNEEAVMGSDGLGVEFEIVDTTDFCNLAGAVSTILKSGKEEMATGGGVAGVGEIFARLFSVEAVDESDKEEATTSGDEAVGKLYYESGVGEADGKKAAACSGGADVESFILEIF